MSEKEAPSLNEENFRESLSKEEKAIVLYYRSTVSGTINNDRVMKALIKELPEDVKFYKVDLSSFSRKAVDQLIIDDIGRDVVPCVIPYKRGYPLESNKVRGPARQEWIEKIVDAYIFDF